MDTLLELLGPRATALADTDRATVEALIRADAATEDGPADAVAELSAGDTSGAVAEGARLLPPAPMRPAPTVLTPPVPLATPPMPTPPVPLDAPPTPTPPVPLDAPPTPTPPVLLAAPPIPTPPAPLAAPKLPMPAPPMAGARTTDSPSAAEIILCSDGCAVRANGRPGALGDGASIPSDKPGGLCRVGGRVNLSYVPCSWRRSRTPGTASRSTTRRWIRDPASEPLVSEMEAMIRKIPRPASRLWPGRRPPSPPPCRR